MALTGLARIGETINRDPSEFDAKIGTAAKGALDLTDWLGITNGNHFTPEQLEALEKYRQENPVNAFASAFIGENAPSQIGINGAKAAIKLMPAIADTVISPNSNIAQWTGKGISYLPYVDDVARAARRLTDEELWEQFANQRRDYQAED